MKISKIVLAASVTVILLLFCSCSLLGLFGGAPADVTTVPSTEVTDAAEEQTTAVPATESAPPLADTAFDYSLKEGTFSLRYRPLDTVKESDIYAACVNGCAEIDARFRKNGVPSTAVIADRADYTDAEIGLAVVNGDEGKAVVFMKFLPVPEPEFMGMHPDYYYVLRTADAGNAWEISVNPVCFYMLNTQSLYFGDHLYVSGYSETNGGSHLCSNDGMDTFTVTEKIAELPGSAMCYVSGIRAADDGQHVIYTLTTTNSGFFIHDGTERSYDAICDLRMNVVSLGGAD